MGQGDSVGPGQGPGPHSDTGGVILGRVHRRGDPVAGANVMILAGPSHPDLGYLSGPDGRFRIAGLAPGTYRVQAMSGTGCGQAEVTLQQAETGRIDIALDPL